MPVVVWLLVVFAANSLAGMLRTSPTVFKAQHFQRLFKEPLHHNHFGPMLKAIQYRDSPFITPQIIIADLEAFWREIHVGLFFFFYGVPFHLKVL